MKTREVTQNRKYWNNFYGTNDRRIPSQFCVSVLSEAPDDAEFVEFGSGNGRDALNFAMAGHRTTAMDLSQVAIDKCLSVVSSEEVDNVTFFQGDLANEAHVKSLIATARENGAGGPISFYSRFVLHSLDEQQEDSFLTALSAEMQKDERVYFEFRSKEDSRLEKHFGGHYRRFIDADEFKKKMATRFNYSISYCLVGRGMAKYFEEDPYVCRLIGTRL